MKYLVMECHPGYAIVLDNDGRFIKAANMNYEVGQTLYNITEFVEMPAEHTIDNKTDSTNEHNISKTKILSLKNHRRLYNLIASAACICLIALNSWYFVFMTYATVEVKINPDVLIYVNSFNYVKNIRSLNSDGDAILEDYNYKGKKLSDVSLELTKTANAMGYLENNNDISIIVRSKHNKWAEKAELTINNEIDSYLNDINREDINFSFTYLNTGELEDIFVIEETESNSESAVSDKEPAAITTTAAETTPHTLPPTTVSYDDIDDVIDDDITEDGVDDVIKDSIDDAVDIIDDEIKESSDDDEFEFDSEYDELDIDDKDDDDYNDDNDEDDEDNDGDDDD